MTSCPFARRAVTLEDLVERGRDRDAVRPDSGRPGVKVSAVAELPTRFGHFRIVAFRNDRDGKEHVALVHGDVAGAEALPTRLHSECLTGDALGSLRCDCRDQLERALRELGSRERGVLIYLRQEGRGIGLLNKVRAYALQDEGLDTVDANLALGFRSDERDYGVAAEMLRCLGVCSVQLMTNNPDKVEQLERHGIRVTARLPLLTPPNEHNRSYLETKAARSGHDLEVQGRPRPPRPGGLVVVDTRA
jgi:GTP cyclohydrolase II